MGAILLLTAAVRIDLHERRRGRGVDVNKIRANKKLPEGGGGWGA